MREVTRDEKFPEEYGNKPQSPPSETELVQIALMMRLYDLGMAILTAVDENKANMVYEAHEKGENFNPPLFIPDISGADSE